MLTVIRMYRDDTEALLARADALEIEVEQLRAELARKADVAEAETLRPHGVPPPIPAPRLHLEPVRSDDRPRKVQAPELIASAEEQVHADALRDRIFLALKVLPV